MKSVTYNGTFAAVDVPSLGLTAERGKSQELSNEKAEKLEKLPGFTVSEPAKDDDDKEGDGS